MGTRIDTEPLRIAMPIGPNGAESTRLMRERIVRRDAAIVIHPKDFAERSGYLLRLIAVSAISDREKEFAVDEQQPRTEVDVGLEVLAGLGDPDILLIDPASIFEPATYD